MSEGTLKKQLVIGADASGVETEIDKTKKSLRGLGAAAKAAGQEAKGSFDGAGKGIEGMGKAGEKASADFDRTTRALQQSILRTIAQMEAGSRSSAKFFEVLATQRGADLNVLRPYLEQLDAVQRKQAVATQALQAGAPAMQQMGISARQLSAAMRGVPAQFTDIVTSLQAGQSPITVFLQQGGQLKDMFGGIGPAARALGGFVLGLVTPLTVGAAAIGAMAVAAHAGSQELRAFEAASVVSGNAAGMSASRFAAMRDSIAGIGATRGKAAEVLTEIASEGRLAGTAIQGIAEAAILMEKATGQATSKTIQQFAELAKSPADAAAKLNEQYNFLTASVFQQIKALEEQGRVTKAAEVAEEAYADALKTRAQAVIDNAGLIEKAWRGVVGVAKSAWDSMLGVGRDLTSGERLAKAAADVARIQAQLAGAGAFADTGGGAAVGGASATRRASLEADLELAKKAMAEAQRRAEIEAISTYNQQEQNRLQQAGIRFIQEGNEYLSQREKLAQAIAKEEARGRELVLAGLITEKDLQGRIAAIREKFKSTGSAVTGGNEVAVLRSRIAAEEELIRRLQLRGVESAKLTEGEKAVLKIQEDLKTSISGQARDQKVLALAEAQRLVTVEKTRLGIEQQSASTQKAMQAHAKLVDAMQSGAAKTLDQAKAQEAANAAFGKSQVAIQEMVLAQIEAEIQRTAFIDGTPAYLAALDAQYEAQQRYVDALKEAEGKRLQLANDDWARANTQEAESLRLQVSLLGVSQFEREKILAQRRVEIRLAEELNRIERSGATDQVKEAERARARQNAAQEAENATQRVVLEDWDRTNRAISDSFVDHLMRGGRSVAQYLRDLFRTLVLRPILQPLGNAAAGVVNSITAPVTNGIVASLTQALGSSVIPIIAPAGGVVDNVLGAFGAGSGIGGSALATAEIASTVATTSEALAAAGATAGEAAAAAAALGESMAATGTALSSISSALAAIPGWGWAAMAALAIFGLDSGGGPKQDGTFGTTVSDIGSAGTTPGLNQAAMQSVAGLQAQFDALAASVGVANDSIRFGVGISTDPAGDSPTFIDFTATRAGEAIWHELNRNVGRSQQELQAALADGAGKAMVGALQAIAAELPQSIQSILAGVTTSSLSAESANAIISRVAAVATSVTEFGKAVALLPFDQLRDLSFDAAAGLIEAAGGLDQLATGLAAYYSNFFSAEEQRAQTVRNIQQALAKVGFDFSEEQIAVATRNQFRALAESIDVSTTAGQQAFAALMSVSGAFAGITEQADQAVLGVDKLASAVGTKLGDVIDLFLTDAEQRSRAAGAISANLAKAGLVIDAETILGATREQFRDLYLELVAAGQTTWAQALLDNAALFASITPEIAAVGAAMANLQSESRSLEVSLLRAQGRGAEADALQRTLDTAGMSDAEIAIYDYNAALRAQIEALDAATAHAEQVAGQRTALERRILELQGDTTAIRALELAALDETLRPLQERVWELEDEAKAEERRKAAADRAREAARALQDAWQSLSDSLLGEVQRLRGIIDARGEGALAQLQGQFAVATAQARAGDQSAAQQLPALSQAIERLAAESGMSALDVDFIRGQLAGSLAQTAATLAQQWGLQLSGANAALLAGVQQPSGLPVPTTVSVPNFGANPAMRIEQGDVSRELAQVKAELVALRQAVEHGLIPPTVRAAAALNGAGDSPMLVEVAE